MYKYSQILAMIYLTSLISCSSGGAGSMRSGGARTKGDDKYMNAYSTDDEFDSEDSEYANVPQAVAGGFNLLDCNYEIPSNYNKSADMNCNAMSNDGNRIERDTFESPRIKVSHADSLSTEISECAEHDTACHWRIRVTNHSDDSNLATMMKSLRVNFEARTELDGRIKYQSTPSAKPLNPNSYDSSVAQHDRLYCENGICRGELGASCEQTCSAKGAVFDPVRQKNIHSQKQCERMRNGDFKPGKIAYGPNPVHTPWGGWILDSFQNAYEHFFDKKLAVQRFMKMVQREGGRVIITL